MAFPTILVNSSTGSDTAASGAGPATAITGTNARGRATSSQNRVGLFESPTPDLSGVLTDGSHVIYIDHGTAGARNFSAITSKKETEQSTNGSISSGTATLTLDSSTGMSAGDVLSIAGAGTAGATLYTTISTVDSSTQVTLSENASTTVSGNAVVCPYQIGVPSAQAWTFTAITYTWAIGGKRASIGGTDSAKLFSNNSTAGDAMPGWTVEMESGHSETIGSVFNIRRSGDTTDGQIILKGTSNAATMPLITFSINDDCIFFPVNPTAKFLLRDFELRNTHATKTSSVAIRGGSNGNNIFIIGVKISHSTNKFWKGILGGGSGVAEFHVENCEVGYTASDGISGGANGVNSVYNCIVHDCGGTGVSGNTGLIATDNEIWGCNKGIVLSNVSSNGVSRIIDRNTIGNCTSDGIEIQAVDASSATNQNYKITNNIIVSNGGYGVNFTGSGMTAFLWNMSNNMIRNNNTNGNTSGSCNLSGILQDDPDLDPQFLDEASYDFRIGPNLRRRGYPSTSRLGQTYNSYTDIGANSVGGASGSRVFGGF